jgi:hypothetical protein
MSLDSFDNTRRGSDGPNTDGPQPHESNGHVTVKQLFISKRTSFGSFTRMICGSLSIYTAANSLVALTGNFSTLHNALKLAALGRT